MKLTIYHLKSCDTCKKAIKALQAANHDLTLIDVRSDGVPVSELDRLVAAVGFDVLMNTRSTTWRELADADKADLNEAKATTLMANHPTLIKRPVIADGGAVSVGWTKEVQAKYI